MPRWSIRLDGDESDLADLARTMNSPELQVLVGEGGYVLRSTSLDNLVAVSEVRAASGPLLATLNGIARLTIRLVRQFGPPSIIYEHRPDRTIQHAFVYPQPAMGIGRAFNARVNSGEAGVGSDTSLGAELAVDDPRVAQALRIFGMEPTWVVLYQVLEVIREDVGDLQSLKSKSWVASSEISRFTRTANSYRALGPAARHAMLREAPPESPMTLSDATDLIRALLRSWLAEKVAARSA
jgi:hypothetical protein